MEMLKKVITWGGIAFIVFFAAFRPGAAGDIVKQLSTVATDIFRGVGEFFGGLI